MGKKLLFIICLCVTHSLTAQMATFDQANFEIQLLMQALKVENVSKQKDNLKENIEQTKLLFENLGQIKKFNEFLETVSPLMKKRVDYIEIISFQKQIIRSYSEARKTILNSKELNQKRKEMLLTLYDEYIKDSKELTLQATLLLKSDLNTSNPSNSVNGITGTLKMNDKVRMELMKELKEKFALLIEMQEYTDNVVLKEILKIQKAKEELKNI